MLNSVWTPCDQGRPYLADVQQISAASLSSDDLEY